MHEGYFSLFSIVILKLQFMFQSIIYAIDIKILRTKRAHISENSHFYNFYSEQSNNTHIQKSPEIHAYK